MKRKLFLITLISFTLFLLAGVTNSFAFCVNNKTDAILQVIEYSGGTFNLKILPGDKKCCNWKNKSCNKQGKKDSIVKLIVERYMKNTNYWIIAKSAKSNKFSQNNICNIEIKADALLVINGNNGNYKCIANDN